MKPKRRKSGREPTIALINIVFLMLVFFMVAGSLAPPMDGDLKLVNTGDLDAVSPPDALVIHADGRLSYRGNTIQDPSVYMAARADELADKAVRIIPDRTLAATQLVAISRELRDAGATRVLIITEQGLK